MTKYARLIDNVAVDVTEVANKSTLVEMFHPDLAIQFVSVPAATINGSVNDGSNWTHPDPAASPAPIEKPNRTLVSRTEYYGLFTPTEEAMIRLAASEEVTPALIDAADDAEKARLIGVASLAVMLRRTDALGPVDTIDLASAQVIGGIDLLATAGLLAPERKEEILAGIAE